MGIFTRLKILVELAPFSSSIKGIFTRNTNFSRILCRPTKFKHFSFVSSDKI
jgi:hypothetical protein